MVGMEELVGAGNVPPGDGKRGEMSGESSWWGDRDCGGFVDNVAGEAVIMFEVSEVGWWSEAKDEIQGSIVRTNTKRNQKEAMLMMKKSMAHLLERVM